MANEIGLGQNIIDAATSAKAIDYFNSSDNGFVVEVTDDSPETIRNALLARLKRQQMRDMSMDELSQACDRARKNIGAIAIKAGIGASQMISQRKYCEGDVVTMQIPNLRDGLENAYGLEKAAKDERIERVLNALKKDIDAKMWAIPEQLHESLVSARDDGTISHDSILSAKTHFKQALGSELLNLTGQYWACADALRLEAARVDMAIATITNKFLDELKAAEHASQQAQQPEVPEQIASAPEQHQAAKSHDHLPGLAIMPALGHYDTAAMLRGMEGGE